MVDIVSVSAYDDAELLERCLHSIRDVLGDVPIQVVDGKYESWPEGDANSSDATPSVAADWDAEYIAGGPYHRECDKHLDRVERVPDGERALFLDADERLLAVDESALDDDHRVAYQPRIFNALVYGPRAVYWPRSFYPETVTEINRWDAYLFDAPCKRTDAITIVHRHDLRERAYREAKYDRFANEDRDGRYRQQMDTYLSDDWDASFGRCPHCNRESLTRSQVTGDGSLSYVEVCVAADGCHAEVVSADIDEWRYLPESINAGLADDPARVRSELLDAGCDFVETMPPEYLRDRMAPVLRKWVDEKLTDGSPKERQIWA